MRGGGCYFSEIFSLFYADNHYQASSSQHLQHSMQFYRSSKQHLIPNPSIPQSLNPSIPQSLNPSIPQSLNPSIPQSLNSPSSLIPKLRGAMSVTSQKPIFRPHDEIKGWRGPMFSLKPSAFQPRSV